MKKKNYFKGEYYKFVTKEGFAFALIDGNMANGKILQIVTEDESYLINDINSVTIEDNKMLFDIRQSDLTLKGTLYLSNKHPLTKDVMGLLRHLPIECKHNIYSMYHTLDGSVIFNNKEISFDKGVGYIEGDEGVNFPSKYVWYNSIGSDYGITLALARIPLTKHISFLGSFLLIKTNDLEIVFSTLNGLKVKERTNERIVLKKGKYTFIINLPLYGGHPLLAPRNGVMKTTIHEGVSVKSSFELYKSNNLILKKDNVIGSLERVDL